MSLLRCNADCTVGERTNFRNRTTFMASGRSYLCHSKRCAALIASAITRSEFMRHEMHAELWRATPHSAYPKNNLIRLAQKIIAKTFLNKRPNACDQTHHEVSSLHPPIVQLLLVQLQQPYHLQSDRKSTRLNSSHLGISYAVFCL